MPGKVSCDLTVATGPHDDESAHDFDEQAVPIETVRGTAQAVVLAAPAAQAEAVCANDDVASAQYEDDFEEHSGDENPVFSPANCIKSETGNASVLRDASLVSLDGGVLMTGDDSDAELDSCQVCMGHRTGEGRCEDSHRTVPTRCMGSSTKESGQSYTIQIPIICEKINPV